MKSHIILFTAAVAAGSIFSHDHTVPNNTDNIVVRNVDPRSIYPTRLSVLSVLKTAIPCSAHYPKPTGDKEAWYSELPADIKTLLPSLYLASTSEVSISRSSSSTVSVSMANLAVSDIFTAACSTSQTTVTSHLTITKTIHHAPSVTASTNSSKVFVTSNGTASALNSTSAVPSLMNGTMQSASPKPSPFTSAAENVLQIETVAAFAWPGVATGFILFA